MFADAYVSQQFSFGLDWTWPLNFPQRSGQLMISLGLSQGPGHGRWHSC